MATTYNFSDAFANFVANNIKAGQFGYSVVTLTEPKMRKTNNPYIGRVKKLKLITNALLGCSYENAVNRLLNKTTTDKTTDKYVAEKPKGMHFVVPNLLLESDSEEGKYYLNLMFRKSTKTKTLWLLDGRLATEKEKEDINTFISTPSACKKQIESGIAEEDVVITNRPMLTNIILIRQSDNKEYNRTDLPYGIIAKLFE